MLRVEPGTPAEAAGLAPGDLLVAANGSDVDALDDLQRALVLAEAPSVEVEVLRGSERMTLRIRPAEAP